MGGLEIQKAELVSPTTGGGIVADRRLFLTKPDAAGRQRVVEHGDGTAAYLLTAGAGDIIPADQVRALGLEIKDGKVAQKQLDKDEIPADDKDGLAIALRKAAEAKRATDQGRGQTDVAVMERAPGEENAATEGAKNAARKPTPKHGAPPAHKTPLATVGTAGTTGHVGPAGTVGPVSTVGKTGVHGTPGPSGTTGATGATGEAGQ